MKLRYGQTTTYQHTLDEDSLSWLCNQTNRSKTQTLYLFQLVDGDFKVQIDEAGFEGTYIATINTLSTDDAGEYLVVINEGSTYKTIHRISYEKQDAPPVNIGDIGINRVQVLEAFVDQDVYDAAAWSAILPLSADSVSDRSNSKDIPDFTRGIWKMASPLKIVR